ncbi:MAG: hypothetical protein UR69_C0002G0145 [Candidatus Moranbacteria bacterium GW2011_GWE2_35_2-]|nr:MAG: hypothetical protein UR69_C0002G0145 [Candidatus Moranbacteria bacterium GW2011_GWE2_35_2-]KKQ22505.1 MAG: hypothetical protein US37_C0002G0130 [Candidatus Moranbacteria bacterium GW2011_GWF2_37_11]KKQ29574.1 MAG: hypothetical protein US44_C0001G0166 [Candidatus Moranbacteria bacterium GW2011_GWD1_37_17]KKQ30555.1 MAG: hypothetical protein US47_C0002G0145 [Candidatus Moranbacteria bacterium GW2011_GWE1_37_24]KKQ47249.1 MAG: hypothetical protein US66_C0015G0010 [Candidatus Moranbacteria 
MNKKKLKLSTTQSLLFIWIIFSGTKELFESWLLNPNDIWLNSPFYIFDTLFSPFSFLLYMVYGKFFSFLPIGYATTDYFGFPTFNMFGTLIVSLAMAITFLIPAFFIGRYINTKNWKKYFILFLSVIIIFDISSFAFATVRGWQNAPLLRANNDAIEKCNKEPIEATNCLEDCEKSLSTLPFPSERTEKMINDYNEAWVKCSSKCSKLSINLQNECLKKTGLPEYQSN